MWLVTSNIDSHSIEWALYNLVPRAFPSYLQGKSPGNEAAQGSLTEIVRGMG